MKNVKFELNSLRVELYKAENINCTLDKLLDFYGEEELRGFDNDRLYEELLKVLCFSYSSILAHFIESNKFYFNKYACDNGLTLNNYIDKVITSNAKVSPFMDKEPIEFFNLLVEFGKDLLAKI